MRPPPPLRPPPLDFFPSAPIPNSFAPPPYSRSTASALASLLKRSNDLNSARSAHDFISQHYFWYSNDTFLANFLIEMYGRCGSLHDVRFLFDRMVAPNLYSWNILLKVYGQNSRPQLAEFTFNVMPSRDVVSWTAMITIFSQHGFCEEAIGLFFEMIVEGIIPNEVAIVCSLEACSSLARLNLGQEVNGIIVKLGFDSDRVVGTALLVMYDKCGCVPEARRVFESILYPDVASWNAMIATLLHNGKEKEAISLFWEMQGRGVNPDNVSYIAVLKASCSLCNTFEIHASIIWVGLGEDIEVSNTLISMYGNQGSLTIAWDIFNRMIHRTVVSWNAILTVFSESHHGITALQIFNRMQENDVIPDKVTFLRVLTACASLASLETGRKVHSMIVEKGYESDLMIGNKIISLYGACDSLNDATNVFDKSCKLDSVTWSSIIWTYCYSNHAQNALDIFYNMHVEMLEPNRAIFFCAIDACGTLGASEHAHLLHGYIVEMAIDQDLLVDNALVNLYGKCCSLPDARNVFESIFDPDDVSWTSLMMGYSNYGCSKEVLDLCCEMLQAGHTVDATCFTCIFLACNHDGLVDASMYYFVSMIKDYSLPVHRNQFLCIVDLLGRSGSLDAAEHLIERLPPEHAYAAWQCLLAACRIHSDIKRGIHAAMECYNLDSNDPVPYILLSNIFVIE